MRDARAPIAEPLIILDADGSTHVYCPVHGRSLIRLRRGKVYLCPRQPDVAREDQCRYRVPARVAWGAKAAATAHYAEQEVEAMTPRVALPVAPIVLALPA